MLHLLLVSLLWALSPGLIKHELTGVPSSAISVLRLGLTAAMFAPWLRVRASAGLTSTTVARLVGIGAVQFGLMYLLYLRAFAHLQAHEVFVFTALTPLYIVVLDGVNARRIKARDLVAAACAIASAVAIAWRDSGFDDVLTGFLLVQGANICFAAGQVAYRAVRPAIATTEPHVFAWQALGGFVATLAVALPTTPWTTLPALLTSHHVVVIAFLGLVASGVGFFVWSIGQTRVSAGVLAVFNNAKIPLGVIVSLVVFHEPADPWRLAVSLTLLLIGLAVSTSQRNR
jgi:drug/metabolite transporter (DMT)-like permease